MKSVWLVLVRVQVLAEGAQGFRKGSEFVLQCLIPVNPLPAALDMIPGLLADNSLRLIDHLMAERFRVDDPNQKYPAEAVKDYLLESAESEKPGFGMYFYSDEEAEAL